MNITKDSKIGEIIQENPYVMPAFEKIGMYCIGCAMANEETLEQACYVHGVPVEELLEAINVELQRQ